MTKIPDFSRFRLTAWLLPVLSLTLFPPVAQAGSPVAGGPVEAPVLIDPETPVRFRMDISSHFEWADATPAGPSGDVFHARLTLPFLVPLSDRWRLLGLVRGGYTDYETAPFDADGIRTREIGALLTLEGQLNEVWSVTGGLIGSAAWEEGASFSDSLNGGGLLMAGYRFSPRLKVSLGALYLTRLNEDPLVVPAPGLDWQPTDSLRVLLYGLELKATQKLNDVWSVYVRGEYDPGGAKLDRRWNTEADSYDDQGFRAAAGITWTPARAFSLSLEGGAAFHEYTLRNDNEEILAKDRLDPAAFVGVSARLTF